MTIMRTTTTADTDVWFAPPRFVPVDDLMRDPEDAAAQLTALSRSTRSVRFALGALESSDATLLPLFEGLAAWRKRERLSLQFACDLDDGFTAASCGAMARAGVSFVTLRRGTGVPAGPLARLNMVKHLHAAEVEVVWEMPAELVESCGAGTGSLHHLPPPVSIAGSGGALGSSAELVARWKSSFNPRSLTYARGPRFVRVFDRRDAARYNFIVLNALQAEIFLFCAEPRALDTIALRFPGVPAGKLVAFLDSLLGARLLARAGDVHLALPIRRSFEESWTSIES